MFSKSPRILKYDAATRFFEARLAEGQPVSQHVLKMIEYVDTLEQFGNPIPQEIAVDRILHSLHKGFTSFRVQYNMNAMDKTLYELHSLLVQVEKDMQLGGSTRKDVLSVSGKGKGKFKKRASKGKKPYQAKNKGKAVENSEPKPKAKMGAAPNEPCFYCFGAGHWKRNCPKYLEDKKAGRVTTAGSEKMASTS